MKFHNIITLTISLSYFCIGCNNLIQQDGVTIQLSFDNQIYPDLLKGQKIISLNSDSSFLIGEINKFIRHKDRIYIMDRKAQAVFVYDTLGNTIAQIARFGQGPEEYMQLTDCYVDHDNSTFNIVSRADKKILTFDLNGKELISISKTPKSFYRLQPIDNGFVGYMGNYGEDPKDRKNLYTLSKDKQILHGWLPIPMKWESKKIGTYSYFSFVDNKTLFSMPFDFNIYEITPDSLRVRYHIDLGPKSWPSDLVNDYWELNIRDKTEFSLKYVLGMPYFQETKSYVLICFIYNGVYYLGVYEKATGLSYIATFDAYMEKYKLFGKIIGMDQDAIYTMIEANTIKRLWDGKDEYNNYEELMPEVVNSLRSKFPKVSVEDNPYIVIYTLQQ